MFIDQGFIAIALAGIIFCLGIYWGRQQGLAMGAKGALDRLEQEGLIRQVEYNGDLQILPVYDKEEK